MNFLGEFEQSNTRSLYHTRENLEKFPRGSLPGDSFELHTTITGANNTLREGDIS